MRATDTRCTLQQTHGTKRDDSQGNEDQNGASVLPRCAPQGRLQAPSQRHYHSHLTHASDQASQQKHLSASTSRMRSHTTSTQGIAPLRSEDRCRWDGTSNLRARPPRGKLRKESGQKGITCTAPFLHCSHSPSEVVVHVVNGRRLLQLKEPCVNSRSPSTRAIVSNCVGDGRSAHSRVMSAMPLVRRLSPCYSKESRQYQGKVSDEGELPAIRLASPSRSVASR